MAEVALLMLMLMALSVDVEGHGMMLDPPQRSSVWRDERFPGAFVNTDDSALFCGGYQEMYAKNGGKCGICGDSFSDPHPRPNEAGGMFAQGFIVRHYKQGDVINVTVKITANHLGYFVFKLCPNNDVTREVTQDCLDKRQLKIFRVGLDGRQIWDDKFPIRHQMYGETNVTVKLPRDVTCTQCVLQWTYVTGHSWGCAGVGLCGIGYGAQEQFINCADVAILPSRHVTTRTPHLQPTANFYPAKPLGVSTSWASPGISSEVGVIWFGMTSSLPKYDVKESSVSSDVSTRLPQRVTNTISSLGKKPRNPYLTKSPFAFLKTNHLFLSTNQPTDLNTDQKTFIDISKYLSAGDSSSDAINDVEMQSYDVISPSVASDPFPSVSSSSNRVIPAWLRSATTSDAEKTTTTTPAYNGDGSDCHSVGAYTGQSKVDEWCRVQCPLGYCPPTHCECDIGP